MVLEPIEILRCRFEVNVFLILKIADTTWPKSQASLAPQV